MDELKQASKLLVEALFIRFKYMVLSMQSYCPVLAESLNSVHEDYNLDKFMASRNMEKPKPPPRRGLYNLPFSIHWFTDQTQSTQANSQGLVTLVSKDYANVTLPPQLNALCFTSELMYGKW